MERLRESAMNVLLKKGISGELQPVILAQVTPLLQKCWLRLHCAYSYRFASQRASLTTISEDNCGNLGAS
jgi:hypothetical protein